MENRSSKRVQTENTKLNDALQKLKAAAQKNLGSEIAPLKTVASVFLDRIKQQNPSRTDFIKAAGLLNSCLKRKQLKSKKPETDNWFEVSELLNVTERYLSVFCDPSKDWTDIVREEYLRKKSHLDRLQSIRKDVFDQLKECYSESWSNYDLTKSDQEQHMVEVIKRISKMVADHMKSFVSDIIKESVRLIGEPPCKFATIGFGSMAREEITPFSDIEFGFLYEESLENNITTEENTVPAPQGTAGATSATCTNTDPDVTTDSDASIDSLETCASSKNHAGTRPLVENSSFDTGSCSIATSSTSTPSLAKSSTAAGLDSLTETPAMVESTKQFADTGINTDADQLQSGPHPNAALQYFATLTDIIHLKILNLGETILPSLCIEYFFENGDDDAKEVDYNSNWFYDRAPRGLSLDGAMPWASKTPKGLPGTSSTSPVSLTQTPTEMANLMTLDKDEISVYHLPHVLATSTFICGHRPLYEDYLKCVEKNLEDKTCSSFNRCRGIKQLEADLLTFTELATHASEGGVCNVKKDIYRLLSLLVNDLKLVFLLKETTPWDILDKLEQSFFHCSDAAKNLRLAIAIANLFRQLTYSHHGGQTEAFSFLKQARAGKRRKYTSGQWSSDGVRMFDFTAPKDVYHLTEPDLYRRFYFTVASLKNMVEQHLQRDGLESFPKQLSLAGSEHLVNEFVQKLLGCTFLDNSAKVNLTVFVNLQVWSQVVHYGVQVIRELLNSIDEHPGCIETTIKQWCEGQLVISENEREIGCCFAKLARAYFFCSKFDLSERCALKSIELLSRCGDLVAQADALYTCGRLYLRLDNPHKAKEFFEKSLEIRQKQCATDANTFRTQIQLGFAYKQNGQIKRSSQLAEEVVSKVAPLCSYGNQPCKIVLADALSLQASVKRMEGFYLDAEKSAIRALRAVKEYYGENSNHLEVARKLGHLGKIYCEMSNYGESLAYLNKRRQMVYAVAEQNDDDKHQYRDLFETYKFLAIVYSDQGRVPQARHFIEEAKQVCRKVYGPHTKNTDRASLLVRSGKIYLAAGNTVKAKKKFDKARSICQVFTGCNIHRRIFLHKLDIHLCEIMIQENKKVEVLVKLEELKKEIQDSPYTSHMMTADIAYLMGVAYLSSPKPELQEKFEEVKNHFETALKLLRDFLGKPSKCPRIALTLQALGYLHSQMKDEKDRKTAGDLYEEAIHIWKTVFYKKTSTLNFHVKTCVTNLCYNKVFLGEHDALLKSFEGQSDPVSKEVTSKLKSMLGLTKPTGLSIVSID